MCCDSAQLYLHVHVLYLLLQKHLSAWHNPPAPPSPGCSNLPTQRNLGPRRMRRAACPYARQGAKPWERLGAGSQHRGRSGSTSKTWVTSSFKGGPVPREPAVRLLPLISFWEARAGGERGLPPGFAVKQKGTKMSNPTNSCLD